MGACAFEAMFLDFGGVVAEEGFRDGLTAIAGEFGLDPAVVVPLGYRLAWSTGFVTGTGSEADFWGAFRRQTGVAEADAVLTETVLARFVVRPSMLALADRARRLGLKTAILSDQTHWLEILDARHGVFSHFDAVFNSYRFGVSKRDRAFFELALAGLAVAPGAALFVDDAAGNVALAGACGLRAILYRDEAGFRRELAELCPALESDHV